jgi:hypothetical protein
VINLEYWNMAKARITTKSGSKVIIEGSPEEVASLLAILERTPTGGSAPKDTPRKKERRLQSNTKQTPTTLLAELADGGFFKKPKELSAIKTALQEQGHYYPVTSLSPAVLRAVRKRILRRIRDGKRWLYVQ